LISTSVFNTLLIFTCLLNARYDLINDLEKWWQWALCFNLSQLLTVNLQLIFKYLIVLNWYLFATDVLTLASYSLPIWLLNWVLWGLFIVLLLIRLAWIKVWCIILTHYSLLINFRNSNRKYSVVHIAISTLIDWIIHIHIQFILVLIYLIDHVNKF